MDEVGMKLWAEKVWRSQPSSLLMKQKSLLKFDLFSSHLTDEVKKCLKENSGIAVIPIASSLTNVIQPLNVCLNKPLKDRLQEYGNIWMISK